MTSGARVLELMLAEERLLRMGFFQSPEQGEILVCYKFDKEEFENRLANNGLLVKGKKYNPDMKEFQNEIEEYLGEKVTLREFKPAQKALSLLGRQYAQLARNYINITNHTQL